MNSKWVAQMCLTLSSCLLAAASNASSCQGVQQISLTQGQQMLGQWQGTSAQLRSFSLNNGFKLGVKVESAGREIYQEMLTKTELKEVPEMVKISLYDMAATPPAYLTTTFGGSNTTQSYGKHGGAARVDEVGEQAIRFDLKKPDCLLSQSQVANLASEKELGQVEEKRAPSKQEMAWREQAEADLRQGKHFIVYSQYALPEKALRRITDFLAKDGIKVIEIAETDSRNSRDYFSGYAQTMNGAVFAKMGREYFKNMEQQLKQEMAE